MDEGATNWWDKARTQQLKVNYVDIHMEMRGLNE